MKRRWHADEVASSLQSIDVRALKARGVDGVMIDLDNTLVKYRALEPADEDKAWVTCALSEGMHVVLVTNNSTPWALSIARSLGIPCVPNARKPLPDGFRRALAVLNVPPERVVVIGDQFFTDILGAKIAGFSAILIPPLGGRDPWNTRPLRIIARLLRLEHHPIDAKNE